MNWFCMGKPPFKRYYCNNSPQLRLSARIHPWISLIFAGKIPEDSPKSGPGYPLGARNPEALIMVKGACWDGNLRGSSTSIHLLYRI